MLFFIDESLIDIVKKGNKKSIDQLSTALQKVCESFRRGKHLVSGEKEVLRFFSQQDILTRRCKNIFLKLTGLSTELYYLKDKLNFSVEVVKDNGIDIFRKKESSVMRICYDIIADSDISDKTVLLAENLNDCKFYEIMTNVYLSLNKIGNINVNFESDTGGGRNIEDVFEMRQNNCNKFCICIVDSDKKYPTDNVGDTANGAQNAFLINCPLCDLFIISSRMIENYIPYKILSDLSFSDRRMMKSINFFDRISSNQHSKELKKYLDYKNGECIKNILERKIDEEIEFWNICLNQGGQIIECIKSKLCEESDDCDCQIFPGFGPHILQKSLEEMEKMSFCKIGETIKGDLLIKWNLIGHLILSWCCSSIPYRS